MKALILYASNSGSTYLVSKLIAEALQKSDCLPSVKKVREATFPMLEEFDVLLLGSPSWLVNNKEGQPHEDMLNFMTNIKALQNVRLPQKIAVFGCGDSSYLNFCNAVDEIENFIKSQNYSLIMPSLKIDGFYFNIEENTKKTLAWSTVLCEQLRK